MTVSYTAEVASLNRDGIAEVRALTKPGSDFHRSLWAGTARGTIHAAFLDGRLVGWARTEEWNGHDTLEAFVHESYRRRGIATFCAAGLRSAWVFRHGEVAVFDERMAVIAAKVGLIAIPFRRHEDKWVRA